MKTNDLGFQLNKLQEKLREENQKTRRDLMDISTNCNMWILFES